MYSILFNVLLWGTALIYFSPERYELSITYSIIILSISAVFYLKWYISLTIYTISLFIVSVSFLTTVDNFIIPQITTPLFLVLIAWVIARVLYYKNMESFVTNKKLEEKQKNMRQEVLEKSQQLKNYESSMNEEIIYSIINLLEIHDRYTVGHSRNVAVISSKIAEQMGLSNKEVKETYWAGMVHDIGKILIPLEILNKKTVLSHKEKKLIEKHPGWGYKVLNNSESLHNLAQYVKHHHERWDGKGYPSAIAGDTIPLISQILSLADTWDAMRSERAYRKPLSKQEALREIKENKGSQFSPQVVEAFLAIDSYYVQPGFFINMSMALKSS